jgi:hypothetical protein
MEKTEDKEGSLLSSENNFISRGDKLYSGEQYEF